MKFNFKSEGIAIDLGTANTLIMFRNKIVVDCPSIITLDSHNGEIVATGQEAKVMQGRTHRLLKTVKPLKHGVIADFNATEKMISSFFKGIPELTKNVFTRSLEIIVCIPSGSTQVEKMAVKELCEKVNAKKVYLVSEPMAAALGAGIDVMRPDGNIIIDIGGGTTEIAVISLGGIVCYRSIKIAGDVFSSDIIYYVRNRYNLAIGDTMAENIKIEIGAVMEDIEDPPLDISIYGLDLITGKPKEVFLSHREISKTLDKSIQRIEEALLETLELAPPEISADIYSAGIYITGGGAMLRGLAKRLFKRLLCLYT